MYHLQKALDLSLNFQSSHLHAKQDRCPRMDPWGTPVIRSDHGECWPFICKKR